MKKESEINIIKCSKNYIRDKSSFSATVEIERKLDEITQNLIFNSATISFDTNSLKKFEIDSLDELYNFINLFDDIERVINNPKLIDIFK